ncbi:glycosyltransferase family 2 protein [Desulfosporosinus youngiae]|uniref:Glycosyl transferase n=1 Tax=Desulfosporosinus youngiae DSM 17734 TaxID=768710 RepID=H5XZF5_9FIRM|nr:glycosyltransferase family 2 protein [Desulfosporosinus youngiae]EHQ91861.1 glycosyl transferase [Desulfosporosinus youngiae DSM 17734]
MQRVFEVSGFPWVSVIVPIYNVEKYLPECLDSIVNQTLKNMEIILVDDGTPDKCGIICDEYAERDSRIIVIHQPNSGVSAARNKGLVKARGDYVIFFDSDDIVPKEACEALYKEAIQTSADVVLGDCTYMFAGTEHRHRTFKSPFVTEERRFIDDIVRMIMYRTYNPAKPDNSTLIGLGAPWQKLVGRELLVNRAICFESRVKGVRDVDSRMLTPYHQAIYYAGKTQSAFVVWVVFETIAAVKAIRAKKRRTQYFE